jgi:predicted lipoprotein with Yx(FWY)xxD motif
MRAITLALAVSAFSAVNADAQAPQARVFTGSAGLILYTIKPGSTADSRWC